MAQTAEKLITRSFSIGKIKKDNIPVEDNEIEDGIDVLNDLMFQLQIDGINLGYSEIDDKEQEVTTPDWSYEMIKTELALRLAQEFNRPADPVLIERADRAMRAVLKMTGFQRGAALPNTLPTGSGNYSGYGVPRFYPDRDCGDILSGNNDFIQNEQGQIAQDDSSCANSGLSSIGDSNG
ncbi:hypothetical protein KAR91_82385 [Candidatus Pacearchaeota archaeon]|nr:hypothetical protein [Candidatus Pacearchaeota archaeon]